VDYTHLYPTLCELVGLPVPEHVKGPSLMPLIQNPEAAWDHVAICSHGRGNHAAVDSQWRYIRYEDGSEELYDYRKDPNEWTNRAAESELAEIKLKLAAHLPKIEDEAPPTSGNPKGKGKGKSKGKGKQAKEGQQN
jgi:arylsulfatase A-like enzyme